MEKKLAQSFGVVDRSGKTEGRLSRTLGIYFMLRVLANKTELNLIAFDEPARKHTTRHGVA
jgi:hypothetical protein